MRPCDLIPNCSGHALDMMIADSAQINLSQYFKTTPRRVRSLFFTVTKLPQTAF
jgi:hypothetical protein